MQLKHYPKNQRLDICTFAVYLWVSLIQSNCCFGELIQRELVVTHFFDPGAGVLVCPVKADLQVSLTPHVRVCHAHDGAGNESWSDASVNDMQRVIENKEIVEERSFGQCVWIGQRGDKFWKRFFRSNPPRSMDLSEGSAIRTRVAHAVTWAVDTGKLADVAAPPSQGLFGSFPMTRPWNAKS